MDSKYICPDANCIGNDTLSEAIAQALGLKCPLCSGGLQPLLDDSVSELPVYPDGLDPAGLPCYLAHPWKEYWMEKHPRVRLQWMVDLVEVAIRWVTAIVFADVLKGNDGVLPSSVGAQIREHIERPTLGRWVAILRELSNAGGKLESPVAPEVHHLYEDSFKEFLGHGSKDSDATEHASFLKLRNHIAHSGGFRKKVAEEYLDSFSDRFLQFMKAVVGSTISHQLIFKHQGSFLSLQGLEPKSVDFHSWASSFEDGVWLMDGQRALKLLPLLGYGPVMRFKTTGVLEAEGSGNAPLVYSRSESRKLSYTPLGRDEAHSESENIEQFRDLFRLNEAMSDSPKATGDGFSWDSFLQEARIQSEDLIGRKSEIKAVKSWEKSMDSFDDKAQRLAWIVGGPGSGKSLLMSKLAANRSNSGQNGLYFHRFRVGDSRNSERSFLRLLRAALWAWEPLQEYTTEPSHSNLEVPLLLEDLRDRLAAIQKIEISNPRDSRPYFCILLDGLDELQCNAHCFDNIVDKLSFPGTIWICSSRPDGQIYSGSSSIGGAPIFPEGLPPMSKADVRQMLIQGIGNARFALLREDLDDEKVVRNPFVDSVVERAEGLPIYVQLVIKDLLAGEIDVREGNCLPNSLVDYYQSLIDRLGISDIRRDLPLLVCLLARACEPLEEEALCILLSGRSSPSARFEKRTRNALLAGAGLLRKTTTKEGSTGYMLYHQSFREFIVGSDSLPAASSLEGSLEEAAERLVEISTKWAELPPGGLMNHLFRWGTEYALWWGDNGLSQCLERLTDFKYLQARTATLPSIEVPDLVSEYGNVLSLLEEGGHSQLGAFRLWEEFFRTQSHILLRGDEQWPVNRILLQLALELGGSNPIRNAALEWAESGECDWTFLLRSRSKTEFEPSSCRRVFEFGDISSGVGAVLEYPSLKLLVRTDTAGATSSRLFLLDRKSGKIQEIPGDFVRVETAMLGASHCIIWGNGGEAYFVDVESSEPRAIRIGQDQHFQNFRVLDDSWIEVTDKDGMVQTINVSTKEESGRSEAYFDSGHREATAQPHATADDLPTKVEQLAARSGIIIQDLDWCRAVLDSLSERHKHVLSLLWGLMDGYQRTISEVGQKFQMRLIDLYLLFQQAISKLSSYDSAKGTPLGSEPVALSDDRFITYTPRLSTQFVLWDRHGLEQIALRGHPSLVANVQPLSSRLFASWDLVGNVRIWSTETGALEGELQGYLGEVREVVFFSEQKVLIQFNDDPFLDIDGCRLGSCIVSLELGSNSSEIHQGHTSQVEKVYKLKDNHFLSWCDPFDGRICEWDFSLGNRKTAAGYCGKDASLFRYGDNTVSVAPASTSFWNPRNGEELLRIHTSRDSLLYLDEDRFLSYNHLERTPYLKCSPSIRIWDTASLDLIAELSGLTEEIERVLVSEDGISAYYPEPDQILKWSLKDFKPTETGPEERLAAFLHKRLISLGLFSQETCKILKRNNIGDILTLVAFSEDQLLAMPGVTNAVTSEIQEGLGHVGLSLQLQVSTLFRDIWMPGTLSEELSKDHGIKPSHAFTDSRFNEIDERVGTVASWECESSIEEYLDSSGIVSIVDSSGCLNFINRNKIHNSATSVP